MRRGCDNRGGAIVIGRDCKICSFIGEAERGFL